MLPTHIHSNPGLMPLMVMLSLWMHKQNDLWPFLALERTTVKIMVSIITIKKKFQLFNSFKMNWLNN